MATLLNGPQPEYSTILIKRQLPSLQTRPPSEHQRQEH